MGFHNQTKVLRHSLRGRLKVVCGRKCAVGRGERRALRTGVAGANASMKCRIPAVSRKLVCRSNRQGGGRGTGGVSDRRVVLLRCAESRWCHCRSFARSRGISFPWIVSIPGEVRLFLLGNITRSLAVSDLARFVSVACSDVIWCWYGGCLAAAAVLVALLRCCHLADAHLSSSLHTYRRTAS